jgi:hypothetical protein
MANEITTKEEHELARLRRNAVPQETLRLTHDEETDLANFEKKLQMVRDRLRGVAHGYADGLILDGPGGVGKSFTVEQELLRLGTPYYRSNSHVSGRGLFDLLAEDPDIVHVVEDAETMLADRKALGVLRSALDGQRVDVGGKTGRLVTWPVHNGPDPFLFHGGVIVVGNRPLADLPELNALKTRVPCIHLKPTDAELRAFMKHLALKGYEFDGLEMKPAEAMEVCQFVLREAQAVQNRLERAMNGLRHHRLDLRLLTGAFHDYLQWQEGDSGCHWHDLVRQRIRERPPTTFGQPVVIGGREATEEQELALVEEILATTTDRKRRFELWHEKTGKSEPTLYRRKSQLERHGGRSLLTLSTLSTENREN